MRRFAALAGPDRALLLRAALIVAVVGAALRILAFATTTRLAERLARGWRGDADRIPWAVQAASRRIPGAHTCLPRAIAAQALFRAAGRPADLKIGVKRGGSGIEAHAWVEAEGRVVTNAPADQFSVLV